MKYPNEISLFILSFSNKKELLKIRTINKFSNILSTDFTFWQQYPKIKNEDIDKYLDFLYKKIKNGRGRNRKIKIKKIMFSNNEKRFLYFMYENQRTRKGDYFFSHFYHERSYNDYMFINVLKINELHLLVNILYYAVKNLRLFNRLQKKYNHVKFKFSPQLFHYF